MRRGERRWRSLGSEWGGWVHLADVVLCCLCCAVDRLGRLSFFLSPAEFGSEKMTRRNKCDVQVQASERRASGRATALFSLPPRAVNSSKAEGDSNSELSRSGIHLDFARVEEVSQRSRKACLEENKVRGMTTAT